MPESLRLPILDRILPAGLRYGANYLVECDSHSIWYETSLTIAAQAVRNGVRTDYHTFTRIPEEIREGLLRLRLDSSSLTEDSFRVLDNYSATTGVADFQELSRRSSHKWLLSLDLKDWAESDIAEIKGEVPDIEKRRLHIDDNTSVLVQYNDEKSFIDHWRTHEIPWNRRFQTVAITSAVTGVYSDAFYRQLESICDGIFDFKSREEEDGKISHYFRVRSIRAEQVDSRWRPLRFLPDGEVAIGVQPARSRDLGISGWLKGNQN